MFRFVSLALVAVAVVALLVTPAPAAPIKIGTKAPEFNGLDATDGKSYSSADFKGKDVLVICITCNHCPVAMGYEDRIIDFAKKHAGNGSKVGFIAINVNPGEEDGLPRMKERVKDKGMTYVYAIDPSQKIARQLGASVTPEFFVFDKERKLVYTGALDDNPKSEKVTKHYLDDAVKAALKAEPPSEPKSTPVGCGIQYQRSSQ